MRKKVLSHVCGNSLGQKALESIVRKCHRYMGVGTGDDPVTSGEIGVLKLLETQQMPPYCIFDVGSHKGQYLDVVLSALDGHDFKVHCFEPSNRVFGSLSSRAGGDQRVVLNNFGLGKQKSRAELFYDSPEAGGTLTKRRLEHIGINDWQSERVDLDTLDEYCRTQNIEYIHLLKIDIEGHEMDLILGAGKMFEKRAIGMVTFEFGGCNIDTRTFFKDFYCFFEDNAMSVHRITPTGYLYPLPGYREIDEQFRCTNFAAIRRGI
ncbi:MAG: FkbM family methyltransferase [Syntrophobacteraceae bacterium]